MQKQDEVSLNILPNEILKKIFFYIDDKDYFTKVSLAHTNNQLRNFMYEEGLADEQAKIKAFYQNYNKAKQFFSDDTFTCIQITLTLGSSVALAVLPFATGYGTAYAVANSCNIWTCVTGFFYSVGYSAAEIGILVGGNMVYEHLKKDKPSAAIEMTKTRPSKDPSFQFFAEQRKRDRQIVSDHEDENITEFSFLLS